MQGGSYLLLEVDNNPILNQKLQSKLLELKKYLKKKNLNYKNLYFDSNKIVFNSDENFEFIKEILQNKQSEINPYYQQFKTHQLDLMQDGNMYSLQFSDYGIVLIKNASLDQAIEIVRRRVDELGTNEPNITKRGNDRILSRITWTKRSREN